MSSPIVLRVRTTIAIFVMGLFLVGCSLTGLYKNAREELTGHLHVGDFGGDNSTNVVETPAPTAP